MTTLNQLIRNPRVPKKKQINTPYLKGAPQRRGVVTKVVILAPRKPNSANRRACKVKLSTGQRITAYIPGEGHNLQEHSIVLIRGGRTKDISLHYKVIRGKFDAQPVQNRNTARSRYGIKRPR